MTSAITHISIIPNAIIKNCTRKMNHLSNIRAIFSEAVKSVQPNSLIETSVKVQGNTLWIKNETFPLSKPCYMIGFGKAVLGMAQALEKILGNHLKEGIVTIPNGLTHPSSSQIQYVEGAKNNLPDEAALLGARKIKYLADNLTEDDLLIVLISGGGSALLPLPKEPISLSEKVQLITQLAKSGANIIELNSVRKRISQLKGGGLLESAHPSKVVSLILSDVIGDPIDYIASGPTVRNQDEDQVAIDILKKYQIKPPESVMRVVGQKLEKKLEHYNVHNFIIGNNNLACQTAKTKAEQLKYNSTILSTQIDGDVEDIAKMYAKTAREIIFAKSLAQNIYKIGTEELELSGNICLIAGGEITVEVTGDGSGGRNQQLALAFSKALADESPGQELYFLSCGTDGIDGPTDAAGAIGTDTLYNCAKNSGLDPHSFLINNDCYNFYKTFEGGDYLVTTGHTGTNVMDLHILLIPEVK